MREKTALALTALTASVGGALAARALSPRDNTLALLSDGYTFISKRCQRYQSDIFETRLMLEKVVCMTGEEAARVFYHPGRFTRQGAMPQTTLRLLQDQGSVQLLDGEAHRRRKQMFMSLMSAAGIRQLADAMEEQWHAGAGKWEGMDKVVLFDEVQEILCRAVCDWAGVPLTESEVGQRTLEFGRWSKGPVPSGRGTGGAATARAYGAVGPGYHRKGASRQARSRRGERRPRHHLAPRPRRRAAGQKGGGGGADQRIAARCGRWPVRDLRRVGAARTPGVPAKAPDRR